MKNVIGFCLVVAFIYALSTTTVLASGDKVRGEKGEGETVQSCQNFDGCPYGEESPQPPSGT